MPIKYYLQPNPITPDPNDQSARVLPNASLSLDDIIARMMQRGTTVTEADARAVLNLFFEVVCDEVVNGNFINLPIANIRSGISGVFTSATDDFDPARHALRATLSPGTLLNEKMRNARLEKTLQPLPSPVLLEFLNINTNTTNAVLTPSGIGQIIGEELKFNPNNPQEGIFFIATDGTETKVQIIASRTEGKLVFAIPNLSPGTYTLEVRRAYTKDNIIRKGVLPDTLTVV